MGRVTSKHASAIEPWNDMRAHKRVRLNVEGKIFLPELQYEEACVILDLSPNGAGMKSTCSAALGSPVVLYVDGFGRFEGSIVRKDRLYVGVKFKYSKPTRNRIAERILGYLERKTLMPAPARNNGRLPFTGIEQTFVEESGQAHSCELVDIALSGISVKSAARPAIGERVLFGRTTTVVARHTDVGFAVIFSNVTDPR